MLQDMKVNTGQSLKAATTVKFDNAAIARAKNLLGTAPRISDVMQSIAAAQEQPYMAVGGEEEGFFSKYKNFIIIGGAVAVVGIAAFIMRRK
jgi:hypothetical protein